MRDQNHSPWGKPPSNGNEKPPKKSMAGFLILAVTVALVVLIIAWVVGSGYADGRGAYLMYDFLLLALVGAGLVGHIVSDPGQALRNVAGWVIIFGVLGLGYSVWNGTSRLGNEFNPAGGEIIENAITFRPDMSGHYYIQAQINGTDINFMVDTEATHVVLTMDDAEKIGYEIDQLTFDQHASTANGIVFSAEVKIDSINVGPIRVESVDGNVNQGELDVSLLGMSFLNQLSGYEVRDGLLTLFP